MQISERRETSVCRRASPQWSQLSLVAQSIAEADDLVVAPPVFEQIETLLEIRIRRHSASLLCKAHGAAI
jgi:hypothetical protein